MPRSIGFIVSVILIACCSTVTYSQIKGLNREKYRININQTSENITIDGLLDEDVWKTAEKAGHLQMLWLLSQTMQQNAVPR